MTTAPHLMTAKYPCCARPARFSSNRVPVERHCSVCKTRYFVTFEISEAASERTGLTVLKAVWTERVRKVEA